MSHPVWTQTQHVALRYTWTQTTGCLQVRQKQGRSQVYIWTWYRRTESATTDGAGTSSFLPHACSQSSVLPAEWVTDDNLRMKMFYFTGDCSLLFDGFVWDAEMKIFCLHFQNIPPGCRPEERQTAWYMIRGLTSDLQICKRARLCAHVHSLKGVWGSID